MTDSALQTQAPTSVTTAEADFATLKAAVGKDLDNSQLKLAVAYAQSVGADLFARQIYPVVMDGRLQFLTSIDFLRVIAERSGKYAGQGSPEYGPDCDCQGEDMVVARKHPEWAEVPIYREGWEHPIVRRAYFHEYLPTEGYRDSLKPKSTWVKMPHVLCAKVSEAAGIRAAFPNDVKGMYTNDEMEQADVPPVTVGELATTSGAGQAGIEIPDDPEEPGWVKHSIKLREAPDGLRTVKKPDWYKGEGGKTVEKLELKGKYGRRNVTVILIGAIAAATDSMLESLTEGTGVGVDGSKYEYEWKEGKPKALQIRNATRIVVNTGGAWVEPGQEAEVEAEPAPEPDHPAEMPEGIIEGEAVEVNPTTGSSEPPLPTPEPTPASSAPTTQPSSSEAPKAGSGAASSGSPTATTSTSQPSATSGETAPTSGDMTAAAADTFEGMLDDADVDPGQGGNPNTGAGWETLPVQEGANGLAVSLEGFYAHGEVVDVPNAPGKMMYDGWVTAADMRSRVHVLMSAKMAATAGVERLAAGEEVYLRGVWRRPNGNPCILADTLRPA